MFYYEITIFLNVQIIKLQFTHTFYYKKERISFRELRLQKLSKNRITHSAQTNLQEEKIYNYGKNSALSYDFE